jgi:hypothetical protein
MMVDVFATSRLVRLVAIALVALVLVGCNAKQTQVAPKNATERAELEQYWNAAAPGVASLAEALNGYAHSFGDAPSFWALDPGQRYVERSQAILNMQILMATSLDRAHPPAALAAAHRQLLSVLKVSLHRMLRVARGRSMKRQLAVVRTAIASWTAQVKRRAEQLGFTLAAPSPGPSLISA